MRQASTIKGVGDDAAVLGFDKKSVLISSDMLMEGVHFNLEYTPLKHLGYKAVIVNLSDIYAMNAIPTQIIVNIALSAKFSVEAVDEIYEGVKLACEKYNVDLAGGDTTSSLTGLAISVAVIGEADKENITYRDGAKKNDLICVTGDLGGAFAGLHLLEREKKISSEGGGEKIKLQGYEYLLARQLKPEAPSDLSGVLREHNIKPTAMIDVSDGLSSEMIHICQSSGLGCKIFQDKIPIADQTARLAGELDIDPVTCALNGGEDYELLFTVSLNDNEKIKDMKGITMIGHMADKDNGMVMVSSHGNFINLKAQGWNALLNEEK